MKYKGSSETVLHRVLTVFFILVVPIFILTNFSLLRSRRDLSCKMSSDCFSKEAGLSHKSFVFLLYGEEDNATYEQNLHSILTQKYEQYRILYLLPKTRLEMLEKLQYMGTVSGKREGIAFIPIETALPTIDVLRQTIEGCKDDEIVIQLHVSDWLAHENVLALLDSTYSDTHNIWLTYSEYLHHPSYQKGTTQSTLRETLKNYFSPKSPWLSSPFKTYYAGLFKQINPDLQATHRKSPSAESIDLYMVPMVDNAQSHIHFFKEALYIRRSH